MTDIQTLTKEKIKLDEPGLYDVIFLNDGITTMEFVVKVLKQIFNKTPGTGREHNTENTPGWTRHCWIICSRSCRTKRYRNNTTC